MTIDVVKSAVLSAKYGKINTLNGENNQKKHKKKRNAFAFLFISAERIKPQQNSMRLIQGCRS